MGVKRLLIVITTLLVCAMLFSGLYQPDTPLMWLASTSIYYAYMRAALIVVLVTLLVTSPPRSGYFRLFLAAFASALAISAIHLSYWYAISLLDAVIFIEVAIIFMIESLEASADDVKKISFSYTLAKKK
ncbi:MAG: hypothetical protein JWO55_600 [Candidatus Saccharibacteria bacterium]|jgi:hypothetical protein|nr:hypothetical protein [Candidatus Saccharibacteria bacterium]